MPGAPPSPATTSRGLASSNWRTGPAVDENNIMGMSSSSSRGGANNNNNNNGSGIGAGSGGNAAAAPSTAEGLGNSSTLYNPFDPMGMSSMPMSMPNSGGSGGSRGAPVFPASTPNSSSGMNVPATAATTGLTAGTAVGGGTGGGSSFFTDAHLDCSYAYCYDRGNGQFTRLVPADMLPPLRDIPAVQVGCAGMLVLPLPRAMPPGSGAGRAMGGNNAGESIGGGGSSSGFRVSSCSSVSFFFSYFLLFFIPPSPSPSSPYFHYR